MHANWQLTSYQVLVIDECTAADCKDKKEFRAKYGPDLFMTDIDEYDRICKVLYTLTRI